MTPKLERRYLYEQDRPVARILTVVGVTVVSFASCHWGGGVAPSPSVTEAEQIVETVEASVVSDTSGVELTYGETDSG